MADSQAPPLTPEEERGMYLIIDGNNSSGKNPLPKEFLEAQRQILSERGGTIVNVGGTYELLDSDDPRAKRMRETTSLDDLSPEIRELLFGEVE